MNPNPEHENPEFIYFKKALQVVVMSLLGLAASANGSKKLLAELVKGP